MAVVKKNREDIWSAFNRGDLLWNEAFELLKECPPSWQSKSWKQRRKEVLENACHTCGKTEQLLIQHLWHPASFKVLCERAKVFLRVEYKKETPFVSATLKPFDPTKVSPQEVIPRDSCPKCGSVNVRFRKKANDWACCYIKQNWGKGRQIVCGHVFKEPQVIKWSKWGEEEWAEMAQRRYEREADNPRREWESSFVEIWRDRICHEATKLAYEEDQRYRAMNPEDIKTLCKNCAFVEDLPLIQQKRLRNLWLS
jgi:hypothetical protein